ncbi:MAG: glutathione peroxidase [Cetobacterium sp.]|uniref:glutathione peroxidase n=1 Tax=unclassified Cetobacterium TaxID=2630983 RepID=UPI000645577F|nr:MULTISPECIES: glutathione peroxidase [unclassified Cetobacterium]
MKNIYDFKVKDSNGNEISLEEYKGKTLLIINTATHCGYTPQYEELQLLYTKYKEKGFEILDFPSNQFGEQTPEENSEILNFCNINFGVKFKIFSKIDVNGNNSSDLFKFLRLKAPKADETKDSLELYKRLKEKRNFITVDDEIKWNFTKFLVNKKGDVIKRFSPTDTPLSFEKDIVKLLEEK